MILGLYDSSEAYILPIIFNISLSYDEFFLNWTRELLILNFFAISSEHRINNIILNIII